ncbi:MAG TPA: carboxymuconolactone decarboxylase family protein [Streptosporangiaceae bacterium]|jgi:alkylhydroperoxidase family enzyme|nr:carboxymuconolactone decarboxylase family protein [Streptosporangiaceae bacterium]
MPAQIPFPDDAAVATALDGAALPMQKAAEVGPLINVFRMLMHTPDIGAGVAQLGSAIFAASALTDVDRELAILACGACFRAPYEVSQHEPISRAVGVSDEQRAAVAEKRWNAGCFTAAQRALLAFVAAVADAPAVPDAAFNAMRQHYSDRQLVEAITLTGNYFLIARLTTVLNVPLDPPADDAVLRVGLAMHSDRWG